MARRYGRCASLLMAGGVMAGAYACGLVAAALLVLAGWQACAAAAVVFAGEGAGQVVNEAGLRITVALLAVALSCECVYLCRELDGVVRGWCGVGGRGVSRG